VNATDQRFQQTGVKPTIVLVHGVIQIHRQLRAPGHRGRHRAQPAAREAPQAFAEAIFDADSYR
jgi:hypothetical protein